MAQNHTKVNNADLQGLMGQRVRIRLAVNTHDRIGVVGAYDSVNQKIRIDQDKTHFWITAINTTAHSISIDNFE